MHSLLTAIIGAQAIMRGIHDENVLVEKRNELLERSKDSFVHRVQLVRVVFDVATRQERFDA